jgi:hypothetical protein
MWRLGGERIHFFGRGGEDRSEGFGLECGGALLRRFGFSFVFGLGKTVTLPAAPPKQGKTKAAEQSTAALQTKGQTATTKAEESGPA